MKTAEDIHDSLINSDNPANRDIVLKAIEQYHAQFNKCYVVIGYDMEGDGIINTDVISVFYDEKSAKDMKFVCESEYRYDQVDIEEHDIL